MFWYHQPILSDCDEEVNIYVVVNRVLDMPLGLYKEGEYIKYGDLSRKAGIIGHRLYIAALYLGIGCSGIGAYYDDEVNTFVKNDEMVLYALAIGK